MNRTISNALRRVSGMFQSQTGSYKRHNRQYEAPDKLEQERAAGREHLRADLINGPELRAKELLSRYPAARTGIDVGSGTGWSAAALSPLLDSVTAIEPSAAAVQMARDLYPPDRYRNITWVTGFAEAEIPKLKLSAPALFLTGCVLSHIRDKETEAICAAIDAAAPTGSVLAFAECWGDEPWHQLMWHVRTKAWWREHLPGWKLEFHGPQVPGETYHKGFWGVKER